MILLFELTKKMGKHAHKNYKFKTDKLYFGEICFKEFETSLDLQVANFLHVEYNF